MELLYFVFFLAAAALIFWGLNRILYALAYPMEQRYLHCRILPVLLVALLVGTNVYTISYPLELLDDIINDPGLSQLFTMILPNRAYELVYMLLVLLGLNLMVSAFVIAVVWITKLIFSRSTAFLDIHDYYGIGKLLHLPWFLASAFYSEEEGSVRLNGRGFTMGIWTKGLKWTFAGLWILEMAVVAASILWGGDSWNAFLLEAVKSWYLLPMASFLLLQQLQYFLEAPSDEEAGTFQSASTQENQSGAYIPRLMDTYRQTFSRSDALLFSDISAPQAPQQNGLGSNDLGNQQIQDCDQPDVLHVLSNQVSQCAGSQSPHYQNALVELLNGHSINICDQYEGEFLIYLCAYLNFHMAQGRTALMLCRDRKRAEQLCEAVNREMRRLNNLYSIWGIHTLEGAEVNSRMSMLICSVDDFLNYHICEKRQDFVGDLFCTIFSDGQELFAGDRLRIQRLFGVLRNLDGIRQYIAFSDINNDSLRTAMEQATKQEVLPFSSNTDYQPHAGVMIWRGESYCRLQQQLGLGNLMSPYMGAALPLALVAIKYDFPRVYVIGSCAPGLYAFNDVLNMSGREVANYIENGANLKSLIRYDLDEALRKQQLSVTVVHDTQYNFLNTLAQWQKYGGSNGSLLHIVSPPYALREYFAANFRSQRLDLKNNLFDALISGDLGTRISHMVILLVQLCDKGMTEKELMDKVREYRWEHENVEQLLRDCLSVVLNREEIHSIYECFHFEEEKRFREDLAEFEIQTRVTVIDATVLNRLHNLSGYAVLVSKDDQRQNLPILCDNLPNYCLPHQILCTGGFLYQIHSMRGGCLNAEQVLPQDLPEYYQLSDFVFENYRQIDSCVDTGIMDLNLCTANVSRSIYGYIACNRGTDFTNGSLLVNSLDTCLLTQMDCVNILEMNIRRSDLGDKSVEAMRLLAFLLKDFAKTLFPTTHQNLFAVLSEGYDDSLMPRVLRCGNDAALDDLVCSLIPRLRNPAAPDSEYITLHVVEFSCVEFGMVQMLYNRYQNVLLMLREYLSWYLSSNTASAEEVPPSGGNYLHFGAASVPGVLAPETLLALLNKLSPDVSGASDVVQVTVDANVPLCTFCQRPSMFPVELADGRRMCRHCKDHQLSQKDEIKSLFAETIQFLTEGYGIAFPRNLHVRFQSADAIRRATGETSGGRVLGFYNSRNRQLWLEAQGPRISMQSTLIHELTHAWQFHEPEFRDNLQRVLRKYPRKDRDRIRLLILEGHAVFMEVETMRKLREDAYADRVHAASMQRQDEYGIGYRMLRDYILNLGQQGSYMTPYKAMIQLLQDIIDGKVTIS